VSRSSPAPTIPEKLWSPIVVGLIVLVPGLAALATGRVLLFPSLGPSALHQAHTPEDPSSRFYNVVVSHVLGLFVGFGAIYAFGLATTPSVFEVGHISPARVGAAVVAVVVSALLELVLRASHPPAASTTLLVALGSFKPVARDAIAVIAGVLLVALVGEAFRRWRLRQPAR
jgi:hypothetical protein